MNLHLIRVQTIEVVYYIHYTKIVELYATKQKNTYIL